MERIVIIGCPGSGKSTLARELGEKLNLTVIHLDRLWWTKGWENVSMEEFDARLEKCDTIIYLDFGRWACLWGMFQRVVLNHGKIRPDMAEGCPERFDWEFFKYIWNFNKNNRVLNQTRIAKTKHAKAVVLKNRKEKQTFLNSI